MDKENKNKIKQFLLLVVSIIFLFFVSYNNLQLQQSNRIKDVNKIDVTNHKKVSAKELFLDSWQIIKSNYYQHDLNKQNWARWKKRYIHQIKTQEDAHLAINSMLASLDDSYSKFMSEEEFSQQNNAINSKLY